MKKVVWPTAKLTSSKRAGTYGSFGELVEKANKLRAEQEAAQAYLNKAMPAMLKLLEIRMTNGEPLTVMRPLRYQTSDFAKSQKDMDDIDRSFYNNRRMEESGDPGKFVDKIVTINPGTQIVLKALDVPMREFIFNDAMGNEHAISFDERNNLMTQTDIFETVRKLLGNKGD